MSKNSFFLFGIILLLMIVKPSLAQTCCSGGAPLTGALNVRTLPGNSWGISLGYNNNVLKDLIQGTKSINEDYISRQTSSIIAQVDYGIGKYLTGTILIPYVQLRQTTRAFGVETRESAGGIGDILLMTQYGKPFPNGSVFILGAGVKIPTGATQYVDKESSIILPANLQPGSGSVDLMTSTQYQTSFNFRRSLKFTQTLNFRYNTSSASFTFHDSYRFGHVFQSFSVISDQLVIAKKLQTPSIILHYRYSGLDISDGNYVDNTGGHWLYIGPGWAVNITSALSIGFTGEIPVYRNLNGFQISTSTQWMFSIQYLLSKQNDIEI